MDAQTSLQKLIKLLQTAYSAEMAAAYAYRGHWRSVKAAEERAEIEKIELEEWHHRRQIGVILQELGTKPRRFSELKFFIIGRILGFLCFFSGWFLPMYGAGKLESQNYKEYELAAQYALDSGYNQYVNGLLIMAEVEKEHERYFRAKVLSHPLHRYFPMWDEVKDEVRITEYGK
jgi:rubrerythrin